MPLSSHYTVLSPLSFIRRSARVFPDKLAVIDEQRQFTYQQLYQRCCRLSNGLKQLGIEAQDRVAMLAPNSAEHLEAHFGVPMSQGVLVALNYRLAPAELVFIINHCKAKVLIIDASFAEAMAPVRAQLTSVEQVVLVGDNAHNMQVHGYEDLLQANSEQDDGWLPADEWETISINYTSGTTGNPKGVMYTHRGSYLAALCGTMEMQINAKSVYLWTLPMFHCNGWCFPWAVTAMGATHVCLRQVRPKEILSHLQHSAITHLCGAPVVLRMIEEGAEEAGVKRFERSIKVCTAAAPPSPSIIGALLELNIDVLHVYGLTETYGPTTVCEVQEAWESLPLEARTKKMARQGVPYLLSEDLTVLDEQGEPTPHDGETLGEVCMRGNIVMKGYFDNPEATAESLRDGWFHSGDLGVMHPDGYIELRDRAKDIIISGGENISTIEVENTLYGHPQVVDVAVVSKPDEKWGEVPVAFVTPKDASAQHAELETELIAFCRERIARFKVPKQVIFQELPRTSTGKVQKFVLRDTLWQGKSKRIAG